MFQIFDCNGQAVGNPKGYRTHRGAQAQCERTGRIRTAIFTAHHLKEWPINGIKHLYSIRWVDPVAAAIVQRAGVPAGRLIVSARWGLTVNLFNQFINDTFVTRNCKPGELKMNYEDTDQDFADFTEDDERALADMDREIRTEARRAQLRQHREQLEGGAQ